MTKTAIDYAARIERLTEIAEEYDTDGNFDLADHPQPNRFCLIEKNRMSTPPFWINNADTVAELVQEHMTQEYAGEWAIEDVVDLDTGESVDNPVTITIEVQW